MSMFNDIDWKEELQKSAFLIVNKSRITRRNFREVHWTFFGPESKKKWYGTLSYTSEGKWDSIATEMVGRFKKNRSPYIQEYQCF